MEQTHNESYFSKGNEMDSIINDPSQNEKPDYGPYRDNDENKEEEEEKESECQNG